VAPSAENVQPWRFAIIDDPEKKSLLAEHAFSGLYRATRWAERAPVLVVIFARLDVLANRIGKQITGLHYYLIDIGIAGEHFVLQAQELGLGSCWIGWFSSKGVKKALHVPRAYRPVCIIALGYPDPNYRRKRSKIPWQNITFFNEYKA
jgi:nitroreductase